MSTVKTQCSSLFGIARKQGWANIDEVISKRTSNTLQCNPNATFRHVLSMTGQSSDLDNPEWIYDYTGRLCLNTISYFLEENNPEGLSLEEFKDKYWHDVLGMESFLWETDPTGILDCGGSNGETTCRDLARAAQLWINDGIWEDEEVVLFDHISEGRTNVYPHKEREYGFGLWLQQVDTPDPVDPSPPYPGRHSMMGIYAQCAHISKDNEAIIVSMGWGQQDGVDCYQAWYLSGAAMVSNSSLIM